MSLGGRHLLVALVLALMAHLALATLFYEPRQSGAVAAGMGGLDIALSGPMGGVEGGEPAEAPATEDPVPVEEESPTEPEMVEEPAPEPEPEPEPVMEEVVQTEPEPELPPPEPEKKPEPKPEKKLAEVKPPAKKPEPVKKAPTPKPQQVAKAPAKKHTSTKTPAPAGSGGAGGNTNSAQAGVGNNSTGGGQPGARADYYALLQAWLERHRRYPRRARLRHQEGTALLYFAIDREGHVLDYRIERSSGHSLLDDEVAAMLSRAEPLPPVPEQLSQARLELLLPIQFALR